MKLITAARSQNISLTVAGIFQKPTLSELSSVAAFNSSIGNCDGQPHVIPFSLIRNISSLERLKEEIAIQCQVNIEAIQDIYPCTAIQEGLVALSNKSPGAYVAQNVYSLPADIDVHRFQQAWGRVAQTEAILRTRIVHIESSGFLQVVVNEPISWNKAASIHEIAEIDRLLPAHNGGSLSRYTIVNALGKMSYI